MKKTSENIRSDVVVITSKVASQLPTSRSTQASRVAESEIKYPNLTPTPKFPIPTLSHKGNGSFHLRWCRKMGIFHLTFTKIHKILQGERSQVSELNKVGIFEIGPVFPKLWTFEILMFFKRIGPKISWRFGVGSSIECHSFISEYFHSIFCSQVEGSMLNKTTQKVFHWWPLNPG